MQTLYLSLLQHYLFCPRQFALIELECAWAENVFTAEGQVMHEKVNSGGHDTRGNIKTVRTLPLGHRALGLEGVADVVEYHTDDTGTQIPFPIEYKRGKPKSHRADEVQLAITPQLAERTGFSDADADKIKEILPKLFEGDASSARPEGSMQVKKVIWWEHSSKSGQHSSAKVHRSLKELLDDNGEFDEDALKSVLEGLEPEIIEGF